jgi:hypothetical protein
MRLIDNPANDYILMEHDPVVGPLATKRHPVGVRAALRKVGVQRIIVKPGTDGWDFEGLADLGKLVNKGASGPPSLRALRRPGAAGRPSTCL